MRYLTPILLGFLAYPVLDAFRQIPWENYGALALVLSPGLILAAAPQLHSYYQRQRAIAWQRAAEKRHGLN